MIDFVRILCVMTFPSATIRFWDGSGPFLDAEGLLWRQANLVEGGLDAIEMAINGEAFTLTLGISGLDRLTTDLAWEDYQNGEIIGAKVQILTQDCDRWGQAIGAPDVRFTGLIDDITFEKVADSSQVTSSIRVDIVNRFTLRTLTNGGVYSDIDQKARSAILNPTAPPDRFCERIPLLIDKTVGWPNW
ncbi:hypothetical protein IB277_31040 [Ensifer sp. ENS07]|uniref:hypothetical protein n=1 Tax=Ensifer sp. ENS07 TaxID=2769274 RepID=UPI001782BB3D|nr:hypothetical protein [Ensifer sp. ENS07]MBD9640735.1 hypothetical protein [Ensifer sp. ENS07]